MHKALNALLLDVSILIAEAMIEKSSELTAKVAAKDGLVVVVVVVVAESRQTQNDETKWKDESFVEWRALYSRPCLSGIVESIVCIY